MTNVGPQGRTGRDPLAPLLDLPGLAEAAEAARVALGKAHRHRANLRKWPVTAAESTVRGARSSSALEGGGVDVTAVADDPVLAGALRVGHAVEGGTAAIIGVWQRAPLQALARLVNRFFYRALPGYFLNMGLRLQKGRGITLTMIGAVRAEVSNF